MIVDTSVWIDCFRGVDNAKTSLVADQLNGKGLICLTPTILQEVLQGIAIDSQFERVRRDMLACHILQVDPVEAAIGAAQLYRRLRRAGITIRKPNDCLIAFYAMFYTMPILHNDVDFDQIARFSTLQVIKP